MNFITIVLLFFFFVVSVFFLLYGYLHIRELKRAKNDLGLALPEKAKTILMIALWFSFFSVGVLLFLLVTTLLLGKH